MDPYLERLFASPNDFQLVDKLSARIAVKADGSDLAELNRLSREERVVFDIEGAIGIIGNGGFRYMFESDLADFTGVADSYDVIGVPRAAKAIREALTVFPNSKPHADVEERLKYLYNTGRDVEEKLEKLSEEVWATNRESHRKLAAFVRANKDAFAKLTPSRWEDIEELKRQDLPPPGPNATEDEVTDWLGSIDAISARKDYFEGKDEISLPAGGNPIISIKLSDKRNSTDLEIATLSTCKCLRELRILTLDESYVTKKGIALLAGFESLESLDLSETDMEDAWLEPIARLTKLRQLDLSGSRLHLAGSAITDSGIMSVAKLSSLERLSLDYSMISDRGLKQLHQLTRLSTLDLRGAKISGAGLRDLIGLPLKVLHLEGSQVTDEGLESLGFFSELRLLDLCDTAVGDAGILHIASCRKIENLFLASTKVTDQGLQSIADLANLQLLNLDLTPVRGPGLSALAKLTQIETLSFFGTLLTDEGLSHLKHLSSLRSLSLTKTRVTDAGLTNLAHLTNLRSLSLDGTMITGSGLGELKNLKSLEYLSLPKAIEESEGVRRLRPRLPNASFYF
jgi:Leucine-rich repeat (LRR) protein